MKITKIEEAVRPGLFPGDAVSCDITHEVQVAGERSWIKYGAASTVQEDESAEQASARVIDHANATAMEAVHKVVDLVREVVS